MHNHIKIINRFKIVIMFFNQDYLLIMKKLHKLII